MLTKEAREGFPGSNIYFRKAFSCILLAILVAISFTGCTDKHEHGQEATEAVAYTCPMHPQIVKNKPGSCPICGMDLVAKHPADTPAMAVSSDLNYLLKPANQLVVSDIKTTKPVQKQLQNDITMSGVVTYNTQLQYIIPARFGGRIEKLYVQFNYQPVRKGQKLYDIYSPELVTAQKELLYLLKNDPSNSALIDGAKQKLLLLGATSGQLNQLVRSGRETYTFSVYSPYSGYVLDPNLTATPTPTPATTAPASGGGGMSGMSNTGGSSMASNSNPAPTTSGGGFAIREGMYVTTGQALLKVVDASQVWAQFKVASTLAGQLKPGTAISITFNQLPSETVQSKVTLVEPVFEAGENFAQVRAMLPVQSKTNLIGQLLTGKTFYTSDTALWIPKEAVLDLGAQAVAFLKENGVFKPKQVVIGQRADGMAEIVSGLDAQDLVATNAQFLVDSESFIRVQQ